MSQENVEIVGRATDGFNREGIAGLLPYFRPEIRWHTTGRFPDRGVYHGRDAVRQAFGEMEAAIEGLVYEVAEIRDAGQWVVVLGRLTGRGRIGKAPFVRPLHTAIRLDEGRYAEVRQFDAPEDAYAAAGLEA
jgi:ketosteroid isomerase-like protein